MKMQHMFLRLLSWHPAWLHFIFWSFFLIERLWFGSLNWTENIFLIDVLAITIMLLFQSKCYCSYFLVENCNKSLSLCILCFDDTIRKLLSLNVALVLSPILNLIVAGCSEFLGYSYFNNPSCVFYYCIGL